MRERDVHDGGLYLKHRTCDDRAAAHKDERKSPDELSGEMAPGIFHRIRVEG
jgi:hypothetical protein